ncbi:MAG: HEAT repeat domain-containing protein [Phycisphaerales bacterium]|nr:HEAT repeat domain-containing protein [Phycisphaerales bacterium]
MHVGPIRLSLLIGLSILSMSACRTSPSPSDAARAGNRAAQLTAIEVSQLREDAITLLLEAADSPSAQARANAIEGLQPVCSRATRIVRAALADENLGVRYAAVATVGHCEMTRLVRAVRPLLRDPSPSVRAMALFSLHRCGDPVDLTPLSALLMDDDPTTRANVAMILGELGNPSAIPMLRNAARRPMPRVSPARARIVQLQITEAMVRLGDNEALESIRAALHAPQEEGEAQAFAASMIGRLGDERSVGTLVLLTARKREYLSTEVRLACAGSLAQLGLPQGGFIADAYRDDPISAIRTQAAYIYGQIGDQANLSILDEMMRDGDELVRISAAAAIVRILSR